MRAGGWARAGKAVRASDVFRCFAQDRNWEVIETTRWKIEQFKRTMPLISDLRNPALRER